MYTLKLTEASIFFPDLFLKKILSQSESLRASNFQAEMLKLANYSNKSSRITLTSVDLISLFLMLTDTCLLLQFQRCFL